MVDRSSSKRCAPIRIRLAVIKYNRVSNLIGKGFSCRENRYRIVADLTRVNKCVLILLAHEDGKSRYW